MLTIKNAAAWQETQHDEAQDVRKASVFLFSAPSESSRPLFLFLDVEM